MADVGCSRNADRRSAGAITVHSRLHDKNNKSKSKRCGRFTFSSIFFFLSVFALLGLAPFSGLAQETSVVIDSLRLQENDLLVDLGFGNYRNVPKNVQANFAENDIIETKPKEDAYRFVKTDRTAKDLFTYQAFVERVIDADTLKVRFDLGFDTWTRQILRLRGIDAPEMDTKEGQAAKTFVLSYIKEAQLVIVHSSRSEKYDRYLADVYIPSAPGNGNAASDIFLNNLLLEQGHAKRA